jgi:transposase
MTALPVYLVDALWCNIEPLLPQPKTRHPLGCHRPRISDRIVFEHFITLLMFGCSYEQAADSTCSASTLRRRREEWIKAGVMDNLEQIILSAYQCKFGLALYHLVIDGCITKAPRGGEVAGKSPVDRAKLGMKRSLAVDANGIPLAVVIAPANVPDSLLLAPTLDKLSHLNMLCKNATVHLDKGYRGQRVVNALIDYDLRCKIAQKWGEDNRRWVVEQTNSLHNWFKRLVWCNERTRRAVNFFIAFSNAIIVLRRYIHKLENLNFQRRLRRAEG